MKRIGLKLFKIKEDKLFDCSPSRDFSAWKTNSYKYSCSSFHELFTNKERCTCGSHAWTNLEAFLALVCVTIEKTLVAYQADNFHYKLAVGVVESSDVQETNYGWTSKELHLKKLVPLVWSEASHPHAEISLTEDALKINFNGCYNFFYGTNQQSQAQSVKTNLAKSKDTWQKILKLIVPESKSLERLACFQHPLIDYQDSSNQLYSEIIHNSAEQALTVESNQIISRTHINRFCRIRDQIANSQPEKTSPRYLRKDLRCSVKESKQKPFSKNTFNQAALGFRAWEINWSAGYPYPKLLSLTSAGGRKSLKPGIQTAGCLQCKKPPHKKHHCGFNAFASLEELFNSEYIEGSSLKNMSWDKKQIVGSVAGIGNLQVHKNHGWRSEKIAAIALLLPSDASIYTRYYQQAKQISEFYSIPLFQDRRVFEEYSLTQATTSYLQKPPLLGADCFD